LVDEFAGHFAAVVTNSLFVWTISPQFAGSLISLETGSDQSGISSSFSPTPPATMMDK
jgi:hypothetical protein